jgi:hypothetical protein
MGTLVSEDPAGKNTSDGRGALPLGALAVIGGILLSSGDLATWTARHGSCNIISENVNCNYVEIFRAWRALITVF